MSFVREGMRWPRPVLFATAATCLATSCTPRPELTVDEPKDPEAQTTPTPEPLGERDVDGEGAIRLTASDGTGLRLVALRARASVQGPLAFTELQMVFENPRPDTIEGRFSIDLPPHAAISRFALRIGPQWQEGEVVERQAARQVFEDFLHRKADPALLEKEAGNRFSARVFPIPAHGHKELILSYSQALPDSRRPYTLPLAGLPRLSSLDVQIDVTEPGRDTPRRITLSRQDLQPREDVVVRSEGTGAAGLRHEDVVVARVAVPGSAPDEPIGPLTIMFDTSASQAIGFDDKVVRLGRLVERLATAEDFALRIVGFDQEVTTIFEGNARALTAADLDRIVTRRAMGASDLAGALRSLAPDATARVVLFSDGVATAGAGDPSRAVAELGKAGVERLDAIVDGGMQDHAMLDRLVTAGLARNGLVIDADEGIDAVATRLRHATLSRVQLDVPGADFWHPRRLDGVQAGDEVLVYAELPADRAMSVVVEGQDAIEVTTMAADGPLLERALVAARVDAMTAAHAELEDADAAARLRRQIVDLSIAHRVISDFTALLVLETEQDYARYNIDREALTDILTVGEHGVERVGRKALDAVKPLRGPLQAEADAWPGSPSAPANDAEDVWGGLTDTEVGEAFGVGGLGLVGTGRGGGGTGEGSIGLGNVGLIGKGGGGGHGGAESSPFATPDAGAYRLRGTTAPTAFRGGTPMVRQQRDRVRGKLDTDIVRRIVRAHINELRQCYNQGLVRNSELEGEVEIAYAIDSGGKVAKAEVESNLADDERVGLCAARAIQRWKFPRPGDGKTVRVASTFRFFAETPPPPPPEPAIPEPPARVRVATHRPPAGDLAGPEPRAVADATASRKLEAYEGRMLTVMRLLDEGKLPSALATALRWRDEEPADVLALVAVGEVLEALGRPGDAARAFGSIIDLFPARADLRRFAGGHLETLGPPGQALALDTYWRAAVDRPDHPNSHRRYAYALLRAGYPGLAFAAIEGGVLRTYPSGRFEGVETILREDLGLIGAAWAAAEPTRKAAIGRRAAAVGARLATGRSTRFVLSWETDGNDVDFHVHDGRDGHAYYGSRELVSGGKLYADVTTGYGPECFTIEGRPTAFPYRFDAHYYARGPMGYGMGALQIVQHDGRGGLRFDDRPFVIMKDGAFVDLGQLKAPLEP